jgi:tetrahydromethanopterin S-methyltransferase subunit E
MKPKSNLNVAGACCLFANGLIFVFYAVSVPGFIRGVHWLITMAAVFFIIALPAIYRSLGKVHKSAARLVTRAFGVGMVMIVISDVLFVSSLLTRLTHDLFYALGNALFVVCLFAIGLLSWKQKWLGILSLVTGIVGVLTYIPGALLLFVPSLLLVGVWSFAMGFMLRRPK